MNKSVGHLIMFLLGGSLLACESYHHVKVTTARTPQGIVEVQLCNLEADTVLLLPKGGNTTYSRLQKNAAGDTATIFLGTKGVADTLAESPSKFLLSTYIKPQECFTTIRISEDSGRLRVIYLPLFIDSKPLYITVGSETIVNVKIYEYAFRTGRGSSPNDK